MTTAQADAFAELLGEWFDWLTRTFDVAPGGSIRARRTALLQTAQRHGYPRDPELLAWLAENGICLVEPDNGAELQAQSVLGILQLAWLADADARGALSRDQHSPAAQIAQQRRSRGRSAITPARGPDTSAPTSRSALMPRYG